MNLIPFTLVGLASVAVAAPVPAKDATRLYACAHDDAIRLQWQPKGWASDQIGYRLMRRQAQSQWQAISPILRPSFDPQRSGQTLGMNEAQASAFNEWKSSGKSKGLTPRDGAIDSAKLRTMLTETSGIPMGEAVSFSYDWNMALMYGMGWVDNTIPSSASNLEYGLFVVRDGEKVDAEPLVTINPVPSSKRSEWVKSSSMKIKVYATQAGQSISWSMPLIEARKMGLFTCRIESKLAGESKWNVISDIPFGVKGESAQWFATDSVLAKEGARTYKLIPMDMFQCTYPSYELLVEKLEHLSPTSANLGPKDIVFKKDGNALVMNWRQPVSTWEEYEVQGFRLIGAFDKRIVAESNGLETSISLNAEALKALPEMMRLQVVFTAEANQKIAISAEKSYTKAELLEYMKVESSVKKD